MTGFGLFAVLLGLVGLLWKLKPVPLPLFCYLIPMVLTTIGVLPSQDPLYQLFSEQLLPVCLVLLLLGTDLMGIARLGPLALGMMLLGSLGTVLGGLISFKLYGRWLPEGSWGAVGALAGSWIGGSANLLAVKESLGVPDSLIGPIVIVDAAIAYSWMGLLLWASAWQERWNRLLRATSGPSPSGHPGRALQSRHPFGGLVAGISLSLLISLGAQGVSRQLPDAGVINSSGWTILIVTTAALFLSLTPLRKLEGAGISRVGTFALYLLLASIGARADFRAIAQAPLFLALGLTWITIHGMVILAGGSLLKAPLGLIATASQAAIGGVVSAPIVGAAYEQNLSGVGLLMAVLGNLLGTPCGILTAWLARLLG
ncbi:MAG: DUF819 family protein [Candidatus Omnitrophica bacterium]|nr:DUF819 family protein [Candidatus Omnitrophota bacterium]